MCVSRATREDAPAENATLLSLLPAGRYDGPDFEEFCIDKGAYLSARRDRTPCGTCPLGELCDAGFAEQIRRVEAGENPSLTEGREFDDEALAPPQLLAGLSPDQSEFVLGKIPSLTKESEVHRAE
jgi:hypothetical protein